MLGMTLERRPVLYHPGTDRSNTAALAWYLTSPVATARRWKGWAFASTTNPGNALKGTYFERGSALCLRALLAASVTDVRMVGAAGATAVLRRLDALRTANQVMRHV
jgi:hypothetical protein